MKFDQILQIHWKRGFAYNGNVTPFNVTLDELINANFGLGNVIKQFLIKRFEFFSYRRNRHKLLIECDKGILRIINIILLKMINTQFKIKDMITNSFIRLFMIRSMRGRCHALGKPSRGQRTWSNAWNAHHCNKTTRDFVSRIHKKIKENTKEVKINYRLPPHLRSSEPTQRKNWAAPDKPKLRIWF